MPILLRSDGGTEYLALDAKLTLEQMQALVGGYIEHVCTRDGRHMVMDEEGKLKGKPSNDLASQLFYPGFDIVMGDVILFTDSEWKQYESDDDDDANVTAHR
jgi:hypothetical protein